jgi:hypothetical protein
MLLPLLDMRVQFFQKCQFGSDLPGEIEGLVGQVPVVVLVQQIILGLFRIRVLA